MTEGLFVAVFAVGLSLLGVVLCAVESLLVRVGWLTDEGSR
jgi:hypothetical protein